MGFYELSKEEREKLVQNIKGQIESELKTGEFKSFKTHASDEDTYIRKTAYLILSRLYRDDEDVRQSIIQALDALFKEQDQKIKQTVVYTLGEIGKIDADKVFPLFETVLNDKFLTKMGCITGALKQMGEKNHEPTIEFVKKHLNHPDPNIRQAIIHGIELRGRTHPEDILPVLREVQNDPSTKVRNKVAHILAQISYKKGCLEKVVAELNTWENKDLVQKAIKEILKVHENYQFSEKTREEARDFIKKHLILDFSE